MRVVNVEKRGLLPSVEERWFTFETVPYRRDELFSPFPHSYE